MIYSQSIELAGGDDDIKTLFFPMALETMPLQWFDKLNPGSIRNWEDLQRVFYGNFKTSAKKTREAMKNLDGQWKR